MRHTSDIENAQRRRIMSAAVLLALLAANQAAPQAMYKYRGENGEWIFSDRPPEDAQAVEIRDLPAGSDAAAVTVVSSLVARNLRFTARNDYYAPVEIIVALDRLRNVEYPDPDQPLRWVVAPRSQRILLELAAIEDNIAPNVDFRYIWLPGDPTASHRPDRPYRAPFSVANDFMVSQAYPVGETHTTPDSYYAVDFAMPIGTDVYAARAGVVFDVASTNFQGGLNPERDGPSANIVRILHDDGSHAVYAHLNWNTIRVQPGDRVERGEYIADSGNTGFSTGPHLHFAVMLNRGMRLESVPVVFEGPNESSVEPATGKPLAAY